MRSRWWSVAVVVWCLVALSGCSDLPSLRLPRLPGASTPAVDQAANAQNVSANVIVLDGSGTMAQTDIEPSRLAAAKMSATDLVGALPTESSLAVLAFGQSTGNSDTEKPRGCQDVTTLVGPGTGQASRDQATSAIATLKASGYTPIGLAMTKAVEQLPNGAGSVVIVTDGEDTCAPPDPCQTAKDLKQAHPDLTISTVGLRLESGASQQLSCIAENAGGIFVTADSTEQLKARLRATTNVEQAKGTLTSNGVGSARLGETDDQIRARESDFPTWDQARPWGDGDDTGGARPYQGTQVSGNGQELVVIVWKDCSYVFDSQRKLVAVLARAGTIDAVKAGDPASKAASVYGQPLASQANSDGTYSVTYAADRAAGTAYQMVLTGDPNAPDTTVKTIVLCRCLPADVGANGQSATSQPTTGSSAAPTQGPAAAVYPATEESGRELTQFLRDNPGLQVLAERDFSDDCHAVVVYGADLARGDLDIYTGFPGGSCGGDPAGAFYVIRSKTLVDSVDGCWDCEDEDNMAAQAKLQKMLEPYDQDKAASFSGSSSEGVLVPKPGEWN